MIRHWCSHSTEYLTSFPLLKNSRIILDRGGASLILPDLFFTRYNNAKYGNEVFTTAYRLRYNMSSYELTIDSANILSNNKFKLNNIHKKLAIKLSNYE